jgi:hypothetical protein
VRKAWASPGSPNVIRVMHALGILQDYLDAGFGFDHVEIFASKR